MKLNTKLSVLSFCVLSSAISLPTWADDLTVWAWDPNFNVAAMHEAAGRYKQQVPDFELEVIDSAREDIEQKLHTMLASGITTSLPDIVLIEDYNAQKFLAAYPGSFLPLQEHINYSEFAPYKVKVMTQNDKIYGIPFDSGVAGLFYRTDYLEKAGFKHEDLVNITWDRFIEIGKIVKEKTGVAMLTYDINDVVLPHIMMQSGGEWFVDEQGKLNISNNRALIKTLETIKAINDAEITRPISGWSSFVGSFNAGLSATVTSGVWIMGSIKSVEEQSGLWRVAPIPRLNIENATHASNQGGSSWYVLSTSDDKPLAIDFLKKTFASDQDMYQTLLVERGALATYLPASTGYAYTVSDPFFGGQPVFSDFSKWVSEIPQVPYGMYTQEIDTAIASEIPAILKGEDVKKVLQRVEKSLKYQGI
ncbi:extracellular solute-binding protein [Vibrio alfacsensis]|uniref:extracellular solute-binding protein n=1 Tax=Vibrio alfacsensis TaxID=1074311 RepID=UPI001BED5415|nr:extracellular solute-binding protein [Vibrio alfacsensis]BCN24589.1 ABC transporter substrate-binding protein [Vibrio alfacsensis]